MYAACRRQNHTTGLRPWKTGKPPCGRWKCTPSAACGGVSPGGGDLLYGFLRSYVAHCLVSIVPPLLRGGKGTGFVGSPWTPENPVTRFPVEKGGAEGTKGGKRPKAAHHRHAIPADESKGIQLEPASSRQQEAGSRLPSPSSPAAPSRPLVFSSISLICFAYRDSSPSAQNDDEGGKARHVMSSDV